MISRSFGIACCDRGQRNSKGNNGIRYGMEFEVEGSDDFTLVIEIVENGLKALVTFRYNKMKVAKRRTKHPSRPMMLNIERNFPLALVEHQLMKFEIFELF